MYRKKNVKTVRAIRRCTSRHRFFAILFLALGETVFLEKIVAQDIAPPNTPTPIVTIVDGVELSIYPFGSVVKNRLWKNKTIAVCWENIDAVEEQIRRISEAAVNSTWAHHSALSFPGWGPCAVGQSGVRIKIADELPHVRTVGRYLNRKPGGVILNFDFDKWRPECSDSPELKLRCIKAMVVHEFGHVIGFAHEHIRSEAPSECKAEKRGTRGTWNVTEYDRKSVMNYCNANWLGDGNLSPRDISAVQTVYGT